MEFVETYGRRAVIAGSPDGVVSAFAEEAARQGCNVVLLARRRPVLEEIAERIRAASPEVEVRVLPFDLAEPDTATAVIEATAIWTWGC
jgi:uncharacterized protein